MLTTRTPLQSLAAQVLVESAIFSSRRGSEYLLTIELDGGLRQEVTDLRPTAFFRPQLSSAPVVGYDSAMARILRW